MLSAIITAASGLSLKAFLNENLFFPMGITEAQSEVVSALQNRLVLRVYWIETPYVTTWEFDFSDDGLSFRFDINVSFTLQAFEVKGSKSGESCAPHLFEGGIFKKKD